MNVRVSTPDADALLRTLADFRFELRRFLHFSEIAATEEGLHPQQHQLLLQVAGAPEGTVVTIAYAAERLGPPPKIMILRRSVGAASHSSS